MCPCFRQRWQNAPANLFRARTALISHTLSTSLNKGIPNEKLHNFSRQKSCVSPDSWRWHGSTGLVCRVLRYQGPPLVSLCRCPHIHPNMVPGDDPSFTWLLRRRLLAAVQFATWCFHQQSSTKWLLEGRLRTVPLSMAASSMV